MMPVLHLIDQASPQACPTTLALMRLTLEAMPGCAVVVGGAPMAWACGAAGLNAQRIGAPFGNALAALPALRHRLGAHRPAIVHAWSLASVLAASTLWPRVPQVLTLTQFLDARALAGLRGHVTRGRVARIVVLSTVHRDALLAAGVPSQVVAVAPPAVDPGMLATADRDALREAWGVDHATRVFALLSDPPEAADALRADLSVGLAYETAASSLRERPRVLLLRHPGQHHRVQARRMMDNYGVGGIIAQEPRLGAPWRVLPGCDAALSIGPAAGLSLRWAMAAGAAIVAEHYPLQTHWLTSNTTALLADRNQPKRLAHRIHEVLLGPEQGRALGVAARVAAMRDANPASYAAAMSAIYQKLA